MQCILWPLDCQAKSVSFYEKLSLSHANTHIPGVLMPPDHTDFPFERLGLLRNPFGSLQVDEWSNLAVIPADVKTLILAGTHLLFLGDKGQGKTSLLHAIRQQITFSGLQTAYERLPRPMTPYQTSLTGLDAFALDEVQRLRPWCWLSLLRQAQRGTRLLLASHGNVRALFWLAGLPLTTLHMHDLITPAHIREVHTRRIAYFTLPEADPIPLTADAIAYLWQHYGTRLRAQESLLYTVFQQIQQPEPVTAAHLQRADTL